MNKKLISVIAAVAILGVSLFVAAQNASTPWEHNFENPKHLTVHFNCDMGTSEYKSYLNVPHTYTGITMKFRGGVFYVYSPNPDSMSPITFSYLKKNWGPLHEVSQGERDAILQVEAPQLYKTMSTGEDIKGCTMFLDGTEKDKKK